MHLSQPCRPGPSGPVYQRQRLHARSSHLRRLQALFETSSTGNDSAVSDFYGALVKLRDAWGAASTSSARCSRQPSRALMLPAICTRLPACSHLLSCLLASFQGSHKDAPGFLRQYADIICIEIASCLDVTVFRFALLTQFKLLALCCCVR